MATATPRIAHIDAPAAWRVADFISDLHLQDAEPSTFAAWRRYMRETTADAVFILGDLFEVWVGDDAAHEPGLAVDSAAVLWAASRERAVFFMAGNRDFLIGEDFLQECGVTLLADPTVLAFAGSRWLLTHGDALCLDDTDYMAFRAQVRSNVWRDAFLARPLDERKAVARSLRQQSERRKQAGTTYADLDADTVRAWLEEARAPVMIHGHTHQPATHDLGRGLSRVVLSDWDAAAQPPRLEVLRLSPAGMHRVDLS